jgi:hypothetical protein
MQLLQLFFLLFLLPLAPVSCSTSHKDQDFAFWEKRAQHALAKKNTAKALIALLRAENKGGMSQRIWAIQQRVTLTQPNTENPALALASEITKSFFLDIPLFVALIFFCGSLLFTGYLFSRARNLGLKNKNSVIFLLIIISALSALRISSDNPNLGVILAPGTELYAGPGENFPIIHTVQQPSIISIRAHRDDFLKINIGAHKGWCKKKLIEPV